MRNGIWNKKARAGAQEDHGSVGSVCRSVGDVERSGRCIRGGVNQMPSWMNAGCEWGRTLPSLLFAYSTLAFFPSSPTPTWHTLKSAPHGVFPISAANTEIPVALT